MADDILLFRFEDNPQHVGAASDYPDGNGALGYAQLRISRGASFKR